MNAQTQPPAIDSLVTVTIDGKTFIGIVVGYDADNGNLQVAIQDLPLPVWATPKAG